MHSDRPLSHDAGTRSRNGPHGVDAARPKPPRRKRAQSDATVTPLARGLAILCAFGPDKGWLGNREIALETGIPAPTVSRLLQSLVALGYLHHDDASRKYALAPAALSLGYAAIADPGIQQAARDEMRTLAEATDTCVLLGARDQLDVLILDTQAGSRAAPDSRRLPGMRMPLADSLMGWTLLASLPESERLNLQGEIERKAGREWPSILPRMTEKIAQVHELGFGMLHDEREPERACIAAPLPIRGRPPLVLGCIGRAVSIEQELGARLVALAHALQARLATGD
ncbi:IclR family transcriptional regulator [Burkholderia ubonensis]|uniref:IclR family transcriptional regulator n=1 Tax=Burkholderia ubonensis subsp. mesacidophila TaxID=265293 RepID=A0A2A4FJE2_9BURK|nr:IclR family transcriptional regulator [Burkholderia ubonensis]PCE32758.1 IclR family transcriptional regulator [Burkholderia ubonensis subsp. mesacidophila]